ncbi:MAG: hypothetical protein JWN86_450 [Planctomycetota bacterium]|nr:hypothetical protein [Planctomycetota bacterium]
MTRPARRSVPPITIDRPPSEILHTGQAPHVTIEPLTYRLDDLPIALGVSRRTLERERSAGRFPRPDLTIGKMPLWKRETIHEWIERGGRA